MSETGRYWSIRRLGEAYRRGETTPTKVTADLLKRITSDNDRLRAYAHVAPDGAMAQAEIAERELVAGFDRGPLHGVPIGLKDNCATKDQPTRAGMPRLDPLWPGEDSTVATRLRRAGAIFPGKLAMTEGATGHHHPDVPPPVNPWGDGLWTGVSSSGSGAATAAGLCQAALGTDTAGSIRFPSASCGLTGLKPTWGLVSQAGVFPFAYSMDHVGPMARSAEDAALVLAAIAGPERRRSGTSLDAPPDYAAGLSAGMAGVAVGVDERFISEDVDPEVSEAVLAAARVFADLGASPTPIAFPEVGEVSAGMHMLMAEVAVSHAETYPSRAAAYGQHLRVLLEHALKTDARKVVMANRARRILWRRLDAMLALTPLVLLPAMACATPQVEEGGEMMSEPVKRNRATRFTVLFNLTGLPTITLPCGFDRRGAPIGMQLVGRAWGEARLLAAAHAFQQATDFHARRPPG